MRAMGDVEGNEQPLGLAIIEAMPRGEKHDWLSWQCGAGLIGAGERRRIEHDSAHSA